MTILEAIKTLQARNQSYVDRKGKSDDYSNKSDEIINAIIEFYNRSQIVLQEFTDQQKEIQRLNLLLSIWGINPDEYKNMSLPFLKALFLELYLINHIPIREHDYHMQILLSHFNAQTMIAGYKQILKDYAETGIEVFKISHPQLKRYFSKNFNDELIKILEKDFYDGNIN